MSERIFIRCEWCRERGTHSYHHTHIICDHCGKVTKLTKDHKLPREEVIQSTVEGETLDRMG